MKIALIGFMGTGKSSAGRRVARALHLQFVDLDDLVVRKAGKSIPEIFAAEGEARFRELEADAVGEVAQLENAVLACGGGVVLNQANVELLKQNAFVVLLTASPEEICRRLKGDELRPLLQGGNRMERVRGLLAVREPLYEKAADAVVDTGGLSASEVAEKIVEIMRKKGGEACELEGA